MNAMSEMQACRASRFFIVLFILPVAGCFIAIIPSMLILASASKRRRDLLTQLGATFRVQAADVDERARPGENPQQLTVRLAKLKARSVLARNNSRDGDDMKSGALVVLAGDTVVALNDEVFGKPRDRAHAAEMLARLSGRTHQVFSAVAVAVASDAHQAHRLSVTEVTFCDLSAQQIKRYCAHAQVLDKAGGYGIQGSAGAFVVHIRGSYSGVVGLPLWETQQLLQEYDALPI